MHGVDKVFFGKKAKKCILLRIMNTLSASKRIPEFIIEIKPHSKSKSYHAFRFSIGTSNMMYDLYQNIHSIQTLMWYFYQITFLLFRTLSLYWFSYNIFLLNILVKRALFVFRPLSTLTRTDEPQSHDLTNVHIWSVIALASVTGTTWRINFTVVNQVIMKNERRG